jgi:hypothetical protein
MKTHSLASVLAIFLATIQPTSAQQPQVPHFTATSLQRGNSISRSSSARYVGGVSTTSTSKDTSRIAAVKVVLRSFSPPKSPYEVQCFFVAKDFVKTRYIFDAQRVPSSVVFDEINIFGRDLFGGSQTIDQAKSTTPITRTTQYGDTVSGTLTTTVRLTTTTPGSTLEGWIVRVISGGKVVRMDASLQELKTFAERESVLLDSVATQVPVSP